MAIERGERPGPWAKGDEYEEQLGPKEVQNIRAHAQEESRKSLARMSGEALLRRSYDAFYNLVEYRGGLTERFTLKRNNVLGRLLFRGYGDGETAGDKSVPASLLSFATAHAEIGGPAHWTVADVEAASEHIKALHPDIHFIFEIDSDHRVFSYNATVPPKNI